MKKACIYPEKKKATFLVKMKYWYLLRNIYIRSSISNGNAYRSKFLLQASITPDKGREDFGSLPNSCDGVFFKNSNGFISELFSYESFIIGVWQGPKYVFAFIRCKWSLDKGILPVLHCHMFNRGVEHKWFSINKIFSLSISLLVKVDFVSYETF